MKRKVRSPLEKPREACGVWLDASAFKRRKVMDLVGKPALRLLKQYSHSSSVNTPLPHTKQTTILAFFAAETAGERKTVANERSSAAASNSPANLKVSDLAGEDRSRESASPPQMQDSRLKSVKETKGLCSSFAPAKVLKSTSQLIKEKETGTEGRDCLTFNFIQHQADKGGVDPLPVAGSPLKENNVWQRLATFSGSSQNLGKRSRRPFVDVSDAENINPEPEEGLNKRAPGLCINFNGLDSRADEGPGSGSPDLTWPLAKNTSSHQVIPCRFRGGEGWPSLRKAACGDRTSAVGSSFHKGHLWDRYSAEKSRSTPLGQPGFSRLTDEESCYDLLFTEDSEGNRVIKH